MEALGILRMLCDTVECTGKQWERGDKALGGIG